MKKRTKTLVALGLTVAGCGLVLRSRAAKWRRETDAMIEKLKANTAANGETVSFRDFDSLPAPVAAYFRFALTEGQPLIRTAEIRHTGEFRLNNQWTPFASIQHFLADPSGFVWNATMKMNSFINVCVRDSYLNGRGAMAVKVLSLLTIIDAHDDANLDAGSLMRYLAELVWLPTALLPSEHLKWTAIDDRRALATLSDCDTKVSLEFSFNEHGEITGFFAPARVYEAKGEYKAFPWAGRLWNYQERNGMMIPLEGEVEWQMPQGNAPYYKGKIVEVRYD